MRIVPATVDDAPAILRLIQGLADYEKLVGALGTAFDGTAQPGTTLPILYDEFGVEAVIPAAKASLYTGTEPATVRPVRKEVFLDLLDPCWKLAGESFPRPTSRCCRC